MQVTWALCAQSCKPVIKCYPYTVVNSDTAYWVPVGEFVRHFDQGDLIKNRDAKDMVDAYSNDWFYTTENEALMFELATIQLINGKTQFISGRHRISVLILHMNLLPIAFCQNAIVLAEQLKLELIDLSKPIELPLLSIRSF